MAYSPIRPVTLAVDFNLPISLSPDTQPPEMWSIATGLDVNITDFLSLQSGIQLRENPHISFGGALDLETISFVVNYNLDLSGKINPMDKFSIEAKLNLGDSGRQALQKKVEDLYASGLEAYAAGETYFPESLGERRYYQPTDRGLEIRIREKLERLRALDRAARDR